MFWSTQFPLKLMPKLPVLTPQKLARALRKLDLSGYDSEGAITITIISERKRLQLFHFIAKTFAKAHCMQF